MNDTPDNVLFFGPGVELEPIGPDSEVIAKLENLLMLARAGQLTGFFMVANMPDRNPLVVRTWQPGDRVAISACLASAQHAVQCDMVGANERD